ncbi:MAG: site-specific recombinase, invertase Pin [Herbinix sp.]|jgi:DNA invertase Pin-like site-specific DNA recombinase|nr:site-specific recombinase, invertase Pin [Herbinix sp.]
MDRAAIYCRLSKEDEDKINAGDASESIQNQKMLLVDYALEQGYQIVDIYADDDFKGFDYNRPEFNRMIADAKLKKFNIILCKTQSRFTRDMELVEKYIHGMFPLLGIRFIGIVDHVDTNLKGNKKARQINGLINEWYCEDLSENIRSVFRAKMEKGQFLGSFASYGYRKDPADKHKLIIDEEAACVVRKIFSWALKGYGAEQICYKLYEEGIPTPTAYKNMQGLKFYHPNYDPYGRDHGLWGATTVKRMLSNQIYMGDMVQGKEKKVSYKSKKTILVPQKEWIIVPNCHDPIIDKETFELVQKMLHTRRKHRNNKNDSIKREPFLLAGKCCCKDCGSPMTKVNGRKQSYLYCKLFYKTKGVSCTRHSIILEEVLQCIEQSLKEFLHEYLSDIKNIQEIIDMIQNAKESELKERNSSKEILRTQEKIKSLQKALTSLYIEKIEGKFTEEEYIRLKDGIQQEYDQWNERSEELLKERDENEKKKLLLEDAQDLIHKSILSIPLSVEIVNEWIDSIEIGEKEEDTTQQIVIHWSF